MTFSEPLTWTCHVCGQRRPDAQIAVYSIDARIGIIDALPEGVEVRYNVRYCRDRLDCMAGAPEVAEQWRLSL